MFDLHIECFFAGALSYENLITMITRHVYEKVTPYVQNFDILYEQPSKPLQALRNSAVDQANALT